MSFLYLPKQDPTAGQRGIRCGKTYLPLPNRTVTESVSITDGLEVYADGSSTAANVGTIVCSDSVQVSGGALKTNTLTDETTGSIQIIGGTAVENTTSANDFNGTLCLAVNLSGSGNLVSMSSTAGGPSLKFKVSTSGDSAAAGTVPNYEVYGPNSYDSTINTVSGSVQSVTNLFVFLFLRASETEADKFDVYFTLNPDNLNKVGTIYKTYLFQAVQHGEEYRYTTTIGSNVQVGSSGMIIAQAIRLYNRRISDAEMHNLICELNAPEQFTETLISTKTTPEIGKKGLVIDLPLAEMPTNGLVFNASFGSDTHTAETGQTMTFGTSGIEFGMHEGIPSISMNRGGSLISFPADDLPISNSPFTISVWFSNPSNDGQESIIIWGLESSGQMLFLCFNEGLLRLDTWFGGTSFEVENLFSADLQLLDVVYDGTTLKAYINAVLVGSVTITLATGTATTAYIGGHPDHSFGWSGYLADLRIYNRALSESELKTLLRRFKKRKLFLPLEESSGVPEANSSGILLNSDHAILSTKNKIFIPILTPSIPSRLRSIVAGNKGKTYTTELSAFGSLDSSATWIGGVLAENGKIYGIPHGAAEILIIDTATDTVTTIPTESGDLKWFGGCLAPNGKIYAIPHTSNKVLVIDPETDTTYTFTTISGDRKWGGGVLGPDGKIYCLPCQEYRIGVIDPETDTLETFGNVELNISWSWKWIGGVLGPDNCIYAFPSNYQNKYVLKIDPVARTTQLIEHGISANYELFQGSVFAPDGQLWGVTCYYDKLVSYSTDTGTVTIHGGVVSGNGKWVGGCLAPNGKLYFAPLNSGSILEVDPDTGSSVEIPIDTALESGNKFRGCVLAPNGSIYFIPYNATSALKLSFTGGLTPFPKDVCESPWLNKF